jgi:RNA polymerase sigma-70 factor (ECF subfamily)
MSEEFAEADLLLACTDEPSRQKLLADLFTRHRNKLRAMIQIRLDPLLRSKLDPSDILQDSFLDASRRLPEYLERRPMPLHLWFRFLTAQKLRDHHRRLLGAHARDARREISMFGEPMPGASSVVLVARLAAEGPSPSQMAMRSELMAQLEKALDEMDPVDREILALRHFECLSNIEVARLLSLEESTASKRYIRALERLKGVLAGFSGDRGGVGP